MSQGFQESPESPLWVPTDICGEVGTEDVPRGETLQGLRIGDRSALEEEKKVSDTTDETFRKFSDLPLYPTRSWCLARFSLDDVLCYETFEPSSSLLT